MEDGEDRIDCFSAVVAVKPEPSDVCCQCRIPLEQVEGLAKGMIRISVNCSSRKAALREF